MIFQEKKKKTDLLLEVILVFVFILHEYKYQDHF